MRNWKLMTSSAQRSLSVMQSLSWGNGGRVAKQPQQSSHSQVHVIVGFKALAAVL
jgi:hypothetical protein